MKARARLRTWKAPLALLLAAIVLTGCDNEPEKPAAGETPAAIAVTVAPVVARQEPVTINGTGSFIAADSSALTPAVEGLVVKTSASLGDFVAQGAPVVVLDQEGPTFRLREAEGREQEALAAIAQAEARLGQASQGGRNLDAVPEVQSAKAALDVALAELKLAQTEEGRSANLLTTGDVSRASYERAAATLRGAVARVASARQQLESSRNTARQGTGAVEAARAALVAARAQTGLARKALTDAVVRAPFAGYLSERSVSVGEYVTTGSKLGRLERIRPLKLQLQVPEIEAGKIRLGQVIHASAQAFGPELFEGKVTTVNAAVNAASRTLLVEATFANADRRLKPGMFATAAIELGNTEERLVVPHSAVQQDNRTDTWRAWVVEGTTARLRIVQPARKEGSSWVLVSGLRSGDKVVTGGGNVGRLSDGAAVTIR